MLKTGRLSHLQPLVPFVPSTEDEVFAEPLASPSHSPPDKSLLLSPVAEYEDGVDTIGAGSDCHRGSWYIGVEMVFSGRGRLHYPASVRHEDILQLDC